MREAVILAGGLGTRLRSVVSDVPKPMAPIRGTPFLELLVRHLIRQGFTHVVLSIGYMAEVITAHFDSLALPVALDFEIEDHPLGTGGAILASLRQCVTESIFVLNGDSFVDCLFPEIEEFHRQHASAVTMVLHRVSDIGRYGAVECGSDGLVTRFSEKGPSVPGLINAGVYLVPKNILAAAATVRPMSWERDYLPTLIPGRKLYGLICGTHFIDIGVPADFAAAQVTLFQS
jgi:D-glycero-alpha-D-manno-heptose 1-phosphate guanylyltransferase